MYPWTWKVCCKYVSGHPLADKKESSVVPAWAVHPSLKTALDSLRSYDRWVAYVVLPIAFQWIEEHRGDVYKRVPTSPKDLTDDVGVVIAAAFSLVEQTPCYQDERALWRQYERQMTTDAAPPNCVESRAEINPIWKDISDHIQEAIRKAFEKHKKVLRGTGGS